MLSIYFQSLTDVAEDVFEDCITSDLGSKEITYDYDLLEHYYAERRQTSAATSTNAQTRPQTATNTQTSGSTTNQTVATSSFITPSATNPISISGSTTTTTPSWSSQVIKRDSEKTDDNPNHPLVLMVNTITLQYNNYALVSSDQ